MYLISLIAFHQQDVSFSSGQTNFEALRVKLEYVRLTKLRRGEVIDDADRQIEVRLVVI